MVALEQTALAAAQVPLQVGAQAEAVMELAIQAASLGNVNAISDAATGLALGRAALTGAGFNVRINAQNLADRTAAQKLIDEIVGLEAAANLLEPQLKQILLERGHISI
jgi:formiminotetrahydrofolate cyclodeaminase